LSDKIINITVPKAFKELFDDSYRYKIFWGGRGAAKSWAFASTLIILGLEKSIRVLCARELQISINDSVHRLLSDIIRNNDLNEFYTIQKQTIESKINDTVFIFKGLKHNNTEIKSMEGIDFAWVEEAQKVSKSSWELLIPTIRKPNSQIWISFNPVNPTDPTYQKFVLEKREDAFVKKVSWRDNPFFSDILNKERLHCELNDPDAYRHIWEGEFDERYSGAVYAKHVAAQREAGRFVSNLYNSNLPVYTAWDLGWSDTTSIWFFQVNFHEISFIDFYENNHEDIDHYSDIIKNKPYKYAKHFVPHDSTSGVLASGGRSVVDLLYKNGILAQRIPATSVQNTIEAVRTTLKHSFFDEKNTQDGVQALMNYHFEYDADRGRFKEKPYHDWSSHAADAIGIASRVWREKNLIIEDKKDINKLHNMTFNDVFWDRTNEKKIERNII